MLCLFAGAVVASLSASEVTLAWTHSVERLPWEEDWRETPSGLEIVEARIRGTGAGMEPPAEARLAGGIWRWRPALPPLPEVVMRRSGAAADYRICTAGRCRPMRDFVPDDADPVVLKPCP